MSQQLQAILNVHPTTWWLVAIMIWAFVATMIGVHWISSCGRR